MSASVAIPLAIFLLLANAFFVGAEFAVLSARRSQIEPLAEQGSRAARTVLWAMEHVSLMLAAAQLGVTVCSTTLGVIAEPAIARMLDGPMIALGLPEQTSHVVAFVLALVLVVFLHVVIGEMVPKNLAVSSPEKAVLLFGPPLVWLSRAVKPVIWTLNEIANLFLRLVGIDPKSEVTSAYTADEVRSIVERSRAEGVLEDPEGLLTGAIHFSDKTAADVMVELSQLICLQEGVTPEHIEREVARTGFSRFPVQKTADPHSIMGYLHVKDVLYAAGEERAEPVPSWRMRMMPSITPEAEIESVLDVMQSTGAHIARVVSPLRESQSAAQNDNRSDRSDRSESEQLLGAVFLEDVIEELVGEVHDAMQRL